jgi:hypothetical protein
MYDAFSRTQGPEGLDEGAFKSFTWIFGLGVSNGVSECIEMIFCVSVPLGESSRYRVCADNQGEVHSNNTAL